MLPAVNWESDVGGLPSPWGPHRSWAPIWSLFEVCFLQQRANINVSTKARMQNQMNTLYCAIPRWLFNSRENNGGGKKSIFKNNNKKRIKGYLLYISQYSLYLVEQLSRIMFSFFNSRQFKQLLMRECFFCPCTYKDLNANSKHIIGGGDKVGGY